MGRISAPRNGVQEHRECLAPLWTAALLALLLALGPAPLQADSSQPLPTRNALFLYSHDAFRSSDDLYPKLRSVIQSDDRLSVVVHAEYLDLLRFPQEEHSRRRRETLEAKFRGMKMDVLVCTGFAALDFALRNRSALFPGVPIVFVAVDRQRLEGVALPSDVTGVTISMLEHASIELALPLQPALSHVVLVGGGSPFEQYWVSETGKDLTRKYPGIRQTVLAGLPLAKAADEVSRLAPGTAVFCQYYSRDRDGRIYTSNEALRTLATVSSVPVYGGYQGDLGAGMVGGYMTDFSEASGLAGELALRVLRGESAAAMPIRHAPSGQFAVDWRAMRRWNLSADALPRGTRIEFRPVTLWDTHRLEILACSGFSLAQTVAIVALLLQRRWRCHAERAVRRLTGRLIHAQEEERKRIARELHDDTGQQIAVLGLTLSSVKRQMAQGGGEAASRLAKAQDGLNALAHSVRAVSHQLHPAVLERCSLGEAIRSHCAEFASASGLTVSVSADDEPLPDGVRLCAYRITQEALQNVAKHASASHVWVTLAVKGSLLELRIADDGIGCPRTVGGKGQGLGLISMDERARALGGSVRLRSRPGSGSLLAARIPIPASPDRGEQPTTAGVAQELPQR